MDRNPIFADLHNHTTASDGDYSPGDLVRGAGQKKISAIAITDHDTLEGIAPALEAGDKEGVRVIPGVEVSVRFKRPDFTGTLHLLCYFKPEKLLDQAFVEQFNRILAGGRGEALVRSRIQQINTVFGPDGSTPLLARPMVLEDISALSAHASRRHFAMALDQTFGIKDSETVSRIIGNDSPAYLPSGIELGDLDPFIKDQKLVCSLAHPAAGSFPGKGHYKEVLPPVETVEQIIPQFLAVGMNALEVYYPGHTPELTRRMADLADSMGLVRTGGSDCHDAADRPFGVAGLDREGFARFEALLDRSGI